MSRNVVDLAAAAVLEKLLPQLEERSRQIAQAAVDEANARIDAAIGQLPGIAVISTEHLPDSEQPAPAGDPKADARNRAWRTLVQGFVATVLVAAVGAFAHAVSADGFDLFSWESWRVAASTGGTAALMAVLAYIQRLVQPPRTER